MVTPTARGIAVCLAVIGAVLIAPNLWNRVAYPIRPADLDAAFKHLASIPLSKVKRAGAITISFYIPNDPVSDRIKRAWGDRGYLLTALDGTNQSLLCFDDLRLRIQGTIAASPVHFRTANSPLYGYSAKCDSFGLSFRASPGTLVRLDIETQSDYQLPPGDLIVAPYWTSEVKDRLVGLDLAEDLRRPFLLLAIFGCAFLLIAGLILLHAWTRPDRMPTNGPARLPRLP